MQEVETKPEELQWAVICSSLVYGCIPICKCLCLTCDGVEKLEYKKREQNKQGIERNKMRPMPQEITMGLKSEGQNFSGSNSKSSFKL